ncbi:hypothetical protein Q1695_000118 [Nippostrongylus brasiliensis]|nr:hypothetical protein Q1695_000118 [Nippostrongylus brasiliensis]
MDTTGGKVAGSKRQLLGIVMRQMISVIFVLLTFCFSPAYVLRVCSRKRYVFTSTAVLQRVHLSTPELCVERCIENMAFCKAAVFMPLKDKSIGVCTLFSENSIQQPMALHPDASVEPVSTVHELLQSCPQFALPEITNRISSNHRRKLESKIGRSRASDEALRPDVFFRDGEQYNDERHRSAADRYATMTPLYHEEGPKYSDSREVHRPKSPFEGVPAIVPVAVLHMGQAIKPAYESCRPGAMCVPTLASLDSSPCPARQGDPCAPKPPCYPTTCMNADSQIVQSTWTEWTQCSQTCGRGTRTRHCSGVGCLGPAVESCSMMLACQEWTLWSSWSACSTSCGEGERKRTRECIGGRDCPGVSITVETCITPPCPSWTEWGPWEGCSVTCGQGQESRHRKCQPNFLCPGPADENRICDHGHCPQWASWSSWTVCTRSCDTGETVRTRECQHGTCDGASEERLLCNQQDCPSWTEWTAWTVCAMKCDEETYRIRNRLCMFNGVTHNGCEGPAQDQSSCPLRACPTWSDWGEWSECSATCGQGNQTRARTCESGSDCSGSSREMRFCQLASCPYWDEWMDWGGCSVTCGLGVCERRRRCVTDDLLNLPNLEELDETVFEMDADRAKSILIARSRSGSSSSVGRNYTSEDVMDRLKRTPMTRIPIDGGGTCLGTDVERKPCDAGPCCSWESWGEWSPCGGCGSQSVSRRNRVCKTDEAHALFTPYSSQVDFRGMQLVRNSAGVPRISDRYQTRIKTAEDVPSPLTPIVPVNVRMRRQSASMYATRGAHCCEGAAVETRPCRVPCQQQRPCEWTQWSEWCGCTACRPGKETRRRYCDRGGDMHGGSSLSDPSCSCVGRDADERECALDKNCEPSRYVEDRGAHSDRGQQAPEDHSRHENDGYVPINVNPSDEYPMRISEFEMVEKKKTAIDSVSSPYPKCRWSKWSEWSECHDSKVRQRNRFCIGSDVLVSDCECMGYSAEEESCHVQRLTTRVVDEVYLSTNPDTKMEENIETAMSPEDSRQIEIALSSSVSKTEKCEWTRWSQWSICTVTCGGGERVRKRRCSCGDLRCGGAPGQETSVCSDWKCEGKVPPMFNID